MTHNAAIFPIAIYLTSIYKLIENEVYSVFFLVLENEINEP